MFGFAPFAAVAFSALAQAQAPTDVAVGAPFAFAPFSAVAFSSLPDPVITLSASTGTFVLTGSAIGVELRRTSSTGSFVLTGNDATLVRAQTFVGEVGTFILTGQPAAQIQQRSAASGTFVLTGNAALVVRGAVFNASGGTFALTGRAATFGLGRTITADRGTFSLTGQNATVFPAKILVAARGTFLLSGNAITLTLLRSQLGQYAVSSLTGPVNAQGQIDANIVRANDNIVAQALTNHDADTTIHVQSGPLARRPTTLSEGSVYIGTDTLLMYIFTGGSWSQVL
jgi:hypothetical protein